MKYEFLQFPRDQLTQPERVQPALLHLASRGALQRLTVEAELQPVALPQILLTGYIVGLEVD